MKTGYVYILSNSKRTVLYTGVTSDLINRVYQHKQGEGSQFTSQFRVYYLVYYEEHQNMYQAITREKQIKKWKRDWKLNLIRKSNPELKDLWDDILPPGRFHF
ncbi:MAG: GIY-YIG nuclease [Balneola sp.]|jgi:putative endonuclease|nr:GIY-YIG nuclease [Balneola sp.]MBE77633.1 GIY-YIG nuclease [Balneola sp.]HBX66186.1 GIY-YIG nuclease [Balneolaceae bacterium]|tara:strand:+ start:106 stop:414 length:309 start_codon:yes stop_codon:yes gene_type:complete